MGGYPDTVGVPNLDFYLSSDFQEPIEANNHYSERLIRLRVLLLTMTVPHYRKN